MAHPEALLISSVLRSQDHITPMINGMNSELFHVHSEEWNWIERYITRRKRTPSKAAFKSRFPHATIYKANDVEHFCDEVKESHMQWVLMDLMDGTATAIEQGSGLENIVADMSHDLIALQAQVLGAAGSTDIVDNWQPVYDEVASRVDRVKKHGMAGLPTGFQTLDQRLGGIYPGHYWVVAARLGQGKTWTAIRMACAAMYEGYRVQYFSLEQSRAQIAMRAHSFFSSKYGKEVFRNLDLGKGESFSLMDYKKFLRKLPQQIDGAFFVNDTSRGRVNPTTIAASIETNRPDIVFVDYLTLMDRPSDDWQGVASLSNAMQQLAQRYQVPVVVLSQINRSGINREPPGPEHISQSDAIGHDADGILTMKQMSDHVMKMRLAKYRHGQDGFKWWVRFTPNSGEMEEVTGDEAQDLMDLDGEDDE